MSFVPGVIGRNGMDDPRFEFGKNWQSFLSTVTRESIAHAEAGLRKLFPDDEIAGSTFLDVGCGSGLSMLAALRLGATEIQGMDLDPYSVIAAERLLAHENARVFQKSILDSSSREIGTFDIVHSWGVLHHTGAMWEALSRASDLVRPGGFLAVALYRATPLCTLWTYEKLLYVRSPRSVRAGIRLLYKLSFLAGKFVSGSSPTSHLRNYHSARGMSWHHDVEDWLGGYPYESASPDEVKARLETLGFQIVRCFEKPAPVAGLFGSHCDEYVAKKLV